MFVLDYMLLGGPEPYPFGSETRWACNHASTAREKALSLAATEFCPVQVSRVVNGAIQPAYIIRPDGGAEPPSNMKQANPREVCKRGKGGPCFCTACREERKR